MEVPCIWKNRFHTVVANHLFLFANISNIVIKKRNMRWTETCLNDGGENATATRARLPKNIMFSEHAVFPNHKTSCGHLKNRVPTRHCAKVLKTCSLDWIEDLFPVLMCRLERPWKIYIPWLSTPFQHDQTRVPCDACFSYYAHQYSNHGMTFISTIFMFSIFMWPPASPPLPHTLNPAGSRRHPRWDEQRVVTNQKVIVSREIQRTLLKDHYRSLGVSLGMLGRIRYILIIYIPRAWAVSQNHLVGNQRGTTPIHPVYIGDYHNSWTGSPLFKQTMILRISQKDPLFPDLDIYCDLGRKRQFGTHTHIYTHTLTLRRERMKWDEMRMHGSACWVFGFAELPFRNNWDQISSCWSLIATVLQVRLADQARY